MLYICERCEAILEEQDIVETERSYGIDSERDGDFTFITYHCRCGGALLETEYCEICGEADDAVRIAENGGVCGNCAAIYSEEEIEDLLAGEQLQFNDLLV